MQSGQPEIETRLISSRVFERITMNSPRPVRTQDLANIIAMVSEVFAEYGLVLDAAIDEPRLLEADTYFRGSGGEFWVVEIDGAIRATGAVYLHPGAGELKSLYVHPTLRRRGVGRQLTQMAIDRARAAGKPRMILWTDTRFRDAHRLYRNMGFREFGLRVLDDSHDSTEFGFEMNLERESA